MGIWGKRDDDRNAFFAEGDSEEILQSQLSLISFCFFFDAW
jgi:hypothetical protein